MRHFGSILLAGVFAPAIFLLTGTGLSAFASAKDAGIADDPLSTLAALGALLLAGLLYGVLVMVRLSPLGPGLAGLAAIGISGWALFDNESYSDAFTQLDVHMGGAVGESGLGLLLAVPLLATLTSPRRWRTDPPPAAQVGRPAPAQPKQPARPPMPDATRQMQVQPEYLTLPDIAPPSLRYPSAAANPPAQPRPASAPTAPAAAAPQPITILSPPAQQVSGAPGEDKTSLDGEEPTKPIT